MRKVYFHIALLAALLTACRGGSNHSLTTEAATDSIPNQTEGEATDIASTTDVEAANFYEQLTFEKVVAFLANHNSEMAAKCALTHIFEDAIEEEGYAGEYACVYGWGVERGEKLDFGYEVKCTSDHACWFGFYADTSRNTHICFKNKADADSFFEKALAYGLVIKDGLYYLPTTKLEEGTVTITDNFGDYQILSDISQPQFYEETGYYVIILQYFS